MMQINTLVMNNEFNHRIAHDMNDDSDTNYIYLDYVCEILSINNLENFKKSIFK